MTVEQLTKALSAYPPDREVQMARPASWCGTCGTADPGAAVEVTGVVPVVDLPGRRLAVRIS